MNSNPFKIEEDSFQNETAEVILRGVNNARKKFDLTTNIEIIGMMTVILNSSLNENMNTFPTTVKFTIPLVVLTTSIILKLMLKYSHNSVYYFPSIMVIVPSIAIIERQIIMDKTFNFAHP